MRLLIIDNGSGQLQTLQDFCARYDTEVIGREGVPANAADEYSGTFDGVILAGGLDAYELTEPEQYDAQISLIRSGKLPIFGVGFGFELVCYAFGAQLSLEAEKADGADRITPTNDGARIFQGTDPIRVAESRRWCVEDLPKGLQVLARSENGIEAIKHKLQPIYGLQIQPADFMYPSDGKLVFANILATFNKR